MLLLLLTIALYVGIAELLFYVVFWTIKGLWHVGKAIVRMVLHKEYGWDVPTNQTDPWDQ